MPRRPFQLLLLILLAAARVLAQQTTVDPQAERTLVLKVNAERIHSGLQPLEVDPQATEAARQHSRRMAERRALSHQFPDEPNFSARLAAAGLRFGESAENVGRAADADDVHYAQMHSPPHRANVLGPAWTIIGVGVVRSGDRLWATLDFAHRIRTLDAAQATALVSAAIARWYSEHKLPSPERHEDPSEDAEACAMARRDSINLHATLAVAGGTRGAVAYTSVDPTELPEQLRARLAERPRALGLGACFARTPSFSGGAFFVVVTIY